MVERSDDTGSEDVRQFYRGLAGIYDKIDALWKLPYRKAYASLGRNLEAHVSSEARILDLGCGTGLNLERLGALGLSPGSYVGVDFSEEMLARAEGKHGHLQSVDFARIDLSSEPLPEGPFDLVLSTWVLEHLSDPVGVVQQAWQRLAPGGYITLLFMVRTKWVKLAGPLSGLSGARVSYGVEPTASSRFPGTVSLDRFAGGTAALAVLHKPSG